MGLRALAIAIAIAAGPAAAMAEEASDSGGGEAGAADANGEGSAKEEPAQKPKLAVLDVAVKNIDKETGAIFSEVLTAEVDALGMFDVISGSDINATLGYEQQKEVLGCDDSSCMAELGGALGADQIVVSQVGKVGSTYVVSIKLVDVRSAKAHKRIYETVGGEVDLVLQTIRAGVGRLFDIPDHSGAHVVAKVHEHHSEEAQGDAKTADTAATEVEKVEKAKGGGFPVVPVILWAGAAAGLGIGIYFGLAANDNASLANSRAVGSQSAIDQAKSSGLIATILYIGSGVLAASGLLVLLLSGGDDEPEAATATLTPYVTPDGFGAALTLTGW